MRDVDLFSRLLCLEQPWRVGHVSLDAKERKIDVWLAHRRNAVFTCPECAIRSPIYDHLPSRSWRHLDHDNCLTWLHARPPRVACRDHGIRQVRVPWELPGSRFTLPFERHAIDVLSRPTSSAPPACFGSVGTRPGTSWSVPSRGPALQGEACDRAPWCGREGGSQATPLCHTGRRPGSVDRGVHRGRPQENQPGCLLYVPLRGAVGGHRGGGHGHVGTVRLVDGGPCSRRAVEDRFRPISYGCRPFGCKSMVLMLPQGVGWASCSGSEPPVQAQVLGCAAPGSIS